MTLEEKLAKFSETLAKETQKRSEKAVQDYEKILTKNLTEHKEEAFRQADLQIQHTHKTYLKEKKKYIASTKLNAKKILRKKSNDLKEEIHKKLINKLDEYKKSSDYEKTLEHMITKADNYAKTETIILIDKSDEKLLERLKTFTKHDVRISDEHLIGGICAFIPSDKILINMSFAYRLRELIEAFDWSEEGFVDEQ